MKHTNYFLISANHDLKDRLSVLQNDDMSDLLGPIMWSGEEVDKGGLSHEDYEKLVKIMFVDTLKRERSSERGFDKVFGDISISYETFDSYWDLKRVAVDWSVEDALEDAIDSGSLAGIKSNNQIINAYLEGLSKK